jgi:tRNA threonylcarbamoyladenosine biosynthesis protein TsaE
MINLPVTVTSLSPDETRTLGAELARLYQSDETLPTFVALYGDLGVGKTAFVSGFAEVLAPGRAVRSPTFALVNEYRVAGYRPLFHFDMYRITSEDDLYSIGYDDYLDAGICLCEWCENIPESIPDEHIEVSIRKVDGKENTRMITMIRKEGAPC